MRSDRKNAVVAGALFITAIVAGILSVPLLSPLDDPDYLVKVAANPTQLTVGALLLLVMAFACAAIAVWLYPVLRKHNEAMALGAVCFRTIEAVLFIAAVAGQLSLLTLSQDYVRAGTPSASHFQSLGASVLAARAWLIFGAGAIAFCLGALLYYWVFYQSRLIPRWLSGWGLIAIGMHLTAALLVVFGQAPFSATTIAMNIPILLNELVLAVWLIAKGFNPSAIASVSMNN